MQTKIFILIVILLTSMNCKKEEQVTQQKEEQIVEYREIPAYVLETTLPETMNYGDTIHFDIKYSNDIIGLCSKLQDTYQDTTIMIKVYIKVPFKLAYRDLEDFFATTSYSFTPSLKGTYIFKFWQGENKYLIDTLEVL